MYKTCKEIEVGLSCYCIIAAVKHERAQQTRGQSLNYLAWNKYAVPIQVLKVHLKRAERQRYSKKQTPMQIHPLEITPEKFQKLY